MNTGNCAFRMRLRILFILFVTMGSNIGLNASSNCPERWFDCGNGKCLADMWRCDGDNDCGNFKDEENCDKDSSSPPKPCLSSQFKCLENGHCIAETWHCDGENDCVDGSDEKNCENDLRCNGFQCKDNHCIPEKWKCDGRKDCPDGSDEGDQCPKNDVCAGHNCSQNCKPAPKGPECYCNEGYELDKDNKTCTDIDECRTKGTCSQICTNLVGSYKCSCIEGYRIENATCRALDTHVAFESSTLKMLFGKLASIDERQMHVLQKLEEKVRENTTVGFKPSIVQFFSVKFASLEARQVLMLQKLDEMARELRRKELRSGTLVIKKKVIVGDLQQS